MQLTEDHSLIRDAARKFAAEVLAPGAAQRDKTSAFPREEITQMGEMGFMGMTVPEAWGGTALGYTAMALVIEEIAAADGAISTILSVQNSLAASLLVRYGTDAQKEEFLRPLAEGRALGAFALTEPQAGSDAAALTTTARQEGDFYVLNGTKQFITSGKEADTTLVLAVTDKTAGKKGISCFIVPTNTPGYDASHLEEKMGQKCSDTAQIVLTECKIPTANRLGGEGEGYKMALANLEGGRIGIAAQSVGMARAAYETALQYASERKSFGKTLLEHQAPAFRLADMATRLEAARLLTLNAAQLKDAGKPCLKEACMAKLYASEMAERVCSEAIQILGGYGYLRDFPLERIYRDARVCPIYEGTSDIQRLIIGREIAP